MVIWLIGMSGSGKTTLGRRLHDHYKKSNQNMVFLDGDLLREVWGDSLGHSIEARRINAHRISHLSQMLDKQGIHVVAAVLSIFPEWQNWNRENLSQYYEIYLDVPMEVLEQRDTKGLYSKARRGEIKDVVGVDISFPNPTSPNITLDDWDKLLTIDATVDKLLSEIPTF
jgi:cytidine diphosphoramidate kinase